MITIADIKSKARTDLAGHYSFGVRLALFYFFINMTTAMIPTLFAGSGFLKTVIYIIACFVSYAISAYISIGLSACFLKLSLGEKTDIGDFFTAMRTKRNMGGLAIWIAFIETVPAILLSLTMSLVPAVYADTLIMKSVVYVLYFIVMINIRMQLVPAYFLIHDIEKDNPALVMTMTSWLNRSVPRGYLIKMWCSFIPLLIAGLLSFGIGLLYVYPYLCCCNAVYYQELCSQAEKTKTE
ncbi:MAG: DUF975 family protein [Lachnospiraceae bacterium]|nr:DUF975 family protein [Lachnospiraceae bacterium]